jgi:molybdopterin-guanine dinucleotide biosynthesis protein A
MTTDHAMPATVGAILAGGLARRFGGGDKTLRTVGGRAVLVRLVDRLAPQVAQLVLNANDDPRRFEALGLPVVADTLPDRPGPLAGVLAALDWAALSAPDVGWVVTVPGDAPFIPRDLVSRLHAERHRDGAVFACAMSGGRTHPVVALWPVSVRGELRSAVAEDGIRQVGRFTQRYPWLCRGVADPACGPVLQRQHAGGPDGGEPSRGTLPGVVTVRGSGFYHRISSIGVACDWTVLAIASMSSRWCCGIVSPWKVTSAATAMIDGSSGWRGGFAFAER